MADHPNLVSWSPYHYTYGNPIKYTDPDGRFPIAPILAWAGKRAAAGAVVDVVTQLAVEKYSNGHDTWQGAWNALDIDGWQVARSAGENLVQGKYTSAALSAAGDVASYISSNEDWTWDGAIMAAGEGALSSILGDKVGSLVAGRKPVSARLQKQFDKRVESMQNSGEFPATVVGAELPNGASMISTSGPPPGKVAPSLEKAANKIGGVGTRRAGNTVGCCGEFQAANPLLQQYPQYTPKDVNFTKAVRPRTGQTIPPCKNCKDIFGIK